jgi:hypothetical protein
MRGPWPDESIALSRAIVSAAPPHATTQKVEYRMSVQNGRLLVGVSAGILLCVLGASGADDAGLNALPDRVFIHRDAKTAVKIPDGWTIIAPYRLRKSSASSVLGVEKENPRVATTIIWSPLGSRPWSDVIRAAEDENLGEEFAILTLIYGKSKVSRPTTIKVGEFTVYKVLVDAGPNNEGKSAGAVYLFETGAGANRWKVKVRAVFPQLNRQEYVKQIEELIEQFVSDSAPLK